MATLNSNDPTSSDTPSAAATAKPWKLWTGRVISALPVLMMTFSASMKLAHTPSFVTVWEHFGFSGASLTTIGLLELTCVALYVFPRTAVLGALALSAYLGGAVTTHVRIGEPFVIPVVLGVLVWVGLYLREDRLRALLPLRR